MKDKFVSPDEAAAIVRDGDTVSVSGFVGTGTPDELMSRLIFRASDTMVRAAWVRGRSLEGPA